MRVECGRVSSCLKSHGTGRDGSDRVGSRRFGSVRVGSGRVGSSRVGSGRVGSGRVGSGRVGSGRVGSGRVGSGRTHKEQPDPEQCDGYFVATHQLYIPGIDCELRIRPKLGTVYSFHTSSRSRMTLDSHIHTVPRRSTSGFHRPGRHRVHQARSAVRFPASRMMAELHPAKDRL